MADDGYVLRPAGVEVVLRDGEGVLEGGGGFDHRGDEAGRDVPFDVAVEEPDAWRGDELAGVLKGWRHWRGESIVGDLSGLSALKRRTMLPIGRTMKVSRLIGTAGKVSLPTYSPASSSERTTAWKA